MDKKYLRKLIGEKKSQLSKEQITAASEILCRKLTETQAYRDARTLFIYLPFNQEVNTFILLKQALRDGKTVAAPKVYGNYMKFRRIFNQNDLEPGYMGIPEPKEQCPEILDSNALMLMPGLAFDHYGNRCGYGGGFYDRYLSDHPCAAKIALCYDFQLVEEIDSQSFDIPVDLVIHCPV